jgi:hypothetical protein
LAEAAAISAISVHATVILAWQFALEGQQLEGTLLGHLVLDRSKIHGILSHPKHIGHSGTLRALWSFSY